MHGALAWFTATIHHRAMAQAGYEHQALELAKEIAAMKSYDRS